MNISVSEEHLLKACLPIEDINHKIPIWVRDIQNLLSHHKITKIMFHHKLTQSKKIKSTKDQTFEINYIYFYSYIYNEQHFFILFFL